MLPAFWKKKKPYTDTIAQAASNTLSSPLKSEEHYQNGPSGREAVSHAKEGLFLSFYSCSSGEQ